MRSPGRSLTRASSIGFGTLFLAVSYACSERSVAPTAAADANPFVISGILSSSLWRVDGGQLSYAGSVSAQGRLTQDTKGVHQQFEPTAVSSAPVTRIAPSLGLSPLLALSANRIPIAHDGQATWRSRLTSPRVPLTTRDGRRISMQRVADPRGGGRPPVATMLYDGDRPVSLVEGVYQKEGKHWKPTRARVTIFGKDGKPAVVTENDFAALQTASVALPGTAAAFADGFRRVGGSLSRLIQPDALYAASPDEVDEERCWRQRIAVISAAAQQVAADIALGVAVTACAATGGITCPAVVAATIAATAAAVNYLIKVIEYDECMSQHQPIIAPAGGNSGGSGGEGGGGCYDVVWEISYDGGWSWSYYGTQRVCDRLYDI